MQFAKENADALISTHWLLAADCMVQPVVNVPLVGSPHLAQRMFHDWVLHSIECGLGVVRDEEKKEKKKRELTDLQN